MFIELFSTIIFQLLEFFDEVHDILSSVSWGSSMLFFMENVYIGTNRGLGTGAGETLPYCLYFCNMTSACRLLPLSVCLMRDSSLSHAELGKELHNESQD